MNAKSPRPASPAAFAARSGSFPALLGALVLLHALVGLPLTILGAGPLRQLALVVTFLASVYVLSADRRTLLASGALMLVATSLAVIGVLLHAPMLTMLRLAVTTVFFVWMSAVCLRQTFERASSDPHALLGAVCGYLLLVATFTVAYELIELAVPGSFAVQGAPVPHGDLAQLGPQLQYFSTVTITTLGYGDIVPVAPVARLAAGTEAIIGQLYVATVIAVLAGRFVGRRDAR